jgi:hypothetical protein
VSQPGFETDTSNSIGGIVLKSTGTGWRRPTGVFLPDLSVVGDGAPLTVLLWFHGHRVRDIAGLFYEEKTRILPAVLGARKRLVVVAPHLGWFQSREKTDYNASALGGGSTAEQYLDQVLAALTSWYHATVNPPGRDAVPTPRMTLGDLYVAGHSGGGTGIRSVVPALGGYREMLRECWGFDCLYAAGQTWYEWARAQGGIPLYFYFGDGTKPSDNGDVLGFWRLVYGTPRNPLPLGRRMLNVHLAPALPGAELDQVAFQRFEDIKARGRPANRYEEVRLKVDPLLDSTAAYWSAILKDGLYGHYRVVSDLLGPRISQSLYF